MSLYSSVVAPLPTRYIMTNLTQAIEKRKRERKSEDHVLDYNYDAKKREATWIEGNHFISLAVEKGYPEDDGKITGIVSDGTEIVLHVYSLFTFTGQTYFYTGKTHSRGLFFAARKSGLEGIEWNNENAWES